MTDPSQQLRGSIYNALTGNIRTPSGVVIGVYSFVSFEKDPSLSFIIIDPQINDVPVLTKDTNNDIHEIDMNISLVVGYSGNEGNMSDVEFPMNQIVSLLANNMLTMADYTCIIAKPVANIESHDEVDTGTRLIKVLTMKYTLQHK